MTKTKIANPPQPARKLLMPTTIRVGSGSGSPGPSKPRKMFWNWGITTTMITATATMARRITAAG